MLAGVLSGLGLFLPYWSKLSISDSESSVRLELTFGIWGSCLTAQAALPRSSQTNETSRHVDGGKAMTNFTCASYFDTRVVGLKCTDISGITGGDYTCERIENDSGKSLCASTAPLSQLLADQTSISSRARFEWLALVKNACSGYGRASVAIACVTAAFTGLTFVLLAFGITCLQIESRIVKAGGLAALTTAFLEVLLGLFWLLEAKPAADAVFGTSYYMNGVSVALYVIGYAAAKSHMQLEQEAQKILEIDFVMDNNNEKPEVQGDEKNAIYDRDASKTAVSPAPKNILC